MLVLTEVWKGQRLLGCVLWRTRKHKGASIEWCIRLTRMTPDMRLVNNSTPESGMPNEIIVTTGGSRETGHRA